MTIIILTVAVIALTLIGAMMDELGSNTENKTETEKENLENQIKILKQKNKDLLMLNMALRASINNSKIKKENKTSNFTGITNKL